MMLWLTQWFIGAQRRSQTLRHFRRHGSLKTLSSRSPDPRTKGDLPADLALVAAMDVSDVLLHLGSDRRGLDVSQAASRLARDGPNEIDHEKPMSGCLHLWRCYKNPFNLLLTSLAALSYLGRDARSTAVICLMVALSTGIRFVQERRSSKAADALKELVRNTATVVRPGMAASEGGATAGQMEVPTRSLVQGDVLALSAGDMVPADCRILDAKELFVAQSAMTGESLPIEKFSQSELPGAGLDHGNLLFMGTSVVSGSAKAVVVTTGPRTYFGKVAARATATESSPSSFQTGVNEVSWLLIRFAMVMVPIVLLINGLTKGNWLEAVLFALSVAVGMTPEMLPMIVTTTLAKGAVFLSRKKVIVKRLDAIQTLGAMDVLCTDKTGTLTQDRIVLERCIDPRGQPSADVLNLAFLNSHYQTGLKNLIDRAILSHIELQAELQLEQEYQKVDEIPFDFERRRMSVVVAKRGVHHWLICKGALEEVLAVCTGVRGQSGSDVPLEADLLEEVQSLTQRLNQEGLRVVAVAMKALPPLKSTYTAQDESSLVLMGFITFLDPPKESAAPALLALAAHGIDVKVLTGDSPLVAKHVCAQVGLSLRPSLLGTAIDGMSNADLAAAVKQHQVFAKLSPLHKERIVRALRANGHVVGYLGDGINDAPALHAADIGISVDSAVDIAKEAADIILLEKSLMVLVEGVSEGRKTFSNMLKYIRLTASSNFGNVLSVLVASAFLPFLPMLPLQLLVQNLLYDFAQTGIPFDNVDEEMVRVPLRWDPRDIGRFMCFFGPISSLFDIIAFATLWWFLGANNLERAHLFQSGWFVVGLLTQTLVVHMIRTPRLPFIESRAAPFLMVTTLSIMVLGVWIPMGPWAAYFQMEALPPAYFPCLLLILSGYCVVTTLAKRLYLSRFRWQ